jgi:Fur family transcriptional regulator, ferric uptake regulator
MQKRFSKKREKILEVLKNANKALSVASIHILVPEIDKVTIYRNLDLFVSEGVVKTLNFGGTETLYEYQQHPHHHAICTECHRVIHFTAKDEKIKKLLGLNDFQVTELEVTVKGICNHKK